MKSENGNPGNGQVISTCRGRCAACHTVEGVANSQVGPDPTHIGTNAAQRKPGVSARDYSTESIRDPEAFVAECVVRSIPGLMTSAITANLSDTHLWTRLWPSPQSWGCEP